MSPKISIIILNYNGYKDTIRCIDSIEEKIKYDNYEIIIVDNASTDDSVKALKSNFPKYKLIKNEKNLGYSRGNNIGIKFALQNGVDYILILNNDTYIKEDFLSKIVDFMEKEKACGIVSPIILNKDETIQFAGSRFMSVFSIFINLFFGSNLSICKTAISERYYETDRICGAAMLIRKEVFTEVGLLDEDTWYGEEEILCFQAKKAGWKVFIFPEAKIFHLQGQSARKNLSITLSNQFLSRIICFQKIIPEKAPILKTIIFINVILRLLFCSFQCIINKDTKRLEKIDAYKFVLKSILKNEIKPRFQ